MDKHKKTVAGTIMTITGGTLWGVSGVCGQFLFQNKDVTASWLVPVRLMMAGIFMLCFYIWKDKKKAFAIWQKKENRWGILIYGLAGMMLCQYSYFQTIEWSNAGTATVIQYLGPALIVVWVCLQTRRLPERKEIIGVLLALLGIFLIATHGNPTSLALSGRALLMGLISAVSVVIYTVQPEKLQKQFPSPLILAWGMLIGGCVLTVLFRPWHQTVIVDAQMVTTLLIVILLGTMASFSLYMTGVKLIGSVKASLYSCVEPVASMVLTAVWMKVQFTLPDIIGTVCIILTIIILALPSGKQNHQIEQ